ncbi:class I SAM-dependent DNA methyltransferase [Apilactobacillus timberlakei]|uniref:type IIG restriction enzyme/methyltransferase n=1 Tax=Apilactobacillus timberlakei TaxID=2008380 RepID=UPI0015E864C7|nr:class I SAM-dependent DNA methyltransferase [Apilactobacillus timberlakei]TPR18314.1 class I SAM-dependent DNA methyltransferase [Apilactobacillus timberlakei]
MVTENNLNKKALNELILYFMRERITNNNSKLTYLIITDGIDWFIFDAILFDRLFAKNKLFVNEYNESQVNKSTLNVSTSDFYNNISSPYVNKIKDQLKFVHMNLNDVLNPKKKKDKLLSFTKMLSPQTLIKIPFVNDSNVLDQKFYDELLYVMGLRDRKDDKGIERLPIEERQSGSLIELVYEDFISTDFNFHNDEQKFDYAINIISTWINRILFLKLLEGQLIKFNNNDKKYNFMSTNKLTDFNKLNELFFGVLAKPIDQRGSLAEKYKYVPYLNSSLFEKSIAENKLGIKPSDLSDDKELPIRKRSVLKSLVPNGTTSLPTLNYLLTFLGSYSFNTDVKASENSSRLINSSVLGLIFEKINGYKDGSYYTPGFVTSFMVHKSINRSIIDKFNSEGFKVGSINDIAEIVPENRSKVIRILKDFKLVDPAVGSGHFLVSALNYLVKLRFDLKLLPSNLRMDINIDIENDELLTTLSEDGNYFVYKRDSETRQRIQETLFNIKLDIIEHNLFGVDINQNSVNITKLRLWIELLKNSYYEKNDNLRTMPNLEMNIKTGNSVVFKYGLDRNLGDVAAHTDLTVTQFKNLVQKYRNTDDKSVKLKIEKAIVDFKNKIVNRILDKSEVTNLLNLSQKRYELKNGITLFDSKNNQFERKKKIRYTNSIKRSSLKRN